MNDIPYQMAPLGMTDVARLTILFANHPCRVEVAATAQPNQVWLAYAHLKEMSPKLLSDSNNWTELFRRVLHAYPLEAVLRDTRGAVVYFELRLHPDGLLLGFRESPKFTSLPSFDWRTGLPLHCHVTNP